MNDPLGLDEPTSLGAPSNHEVATAVAHAIDSVARLSQFLPLSPDVTSRFRAEVFQSWRNLLSNFEVEDGSDDAITAIVPSGVHADGVAGDLDLGSEGESDG